MDVGERDELERLRARAYGPSADIADDPAAIDRLRELEDRERVREDPPTAAAVPDDPAVTADHRTGAAPGDADDLDDPSPAPRRPLLRSRRRVWITAAAIAAVVALTSGVTAAGVTFTAVDRTSGIAQTDTLTPDPDLELGSAGYLGFDPSEVRGFADYYGLTVFSGRTQIDSAGNTADCLVVNDTVGLRDGDTTRSSGGAVRFGGCGAGPFPASVEFIVSPTFPEAFRTRFPVGTALQFVLDGDAVGVFSADG